MINCCPDTICSCWFVMRISRITEYLDMDCFRRMLDGFVRLYVHYPWHPPADTGYGSYKNYLYCAECGVEKYMKFTMYEKECKDKKYQNDLYRAINFASDQDGYMVCSNGK